MTPPEALAAADKINRSKQWRCNNVTADHSGYRRQGRWFVNEFPFDPRDRSEYQSTFMTHKELIEFAKTLEETE